MTPGAQVGSSRRLASRLELGRSLIHGLYVALCCERDGQRDARDRTIADLHGWLSSAVEPVALTVHDRGLRVDGLRVAVGSTTFVASEFIRELLRGRGIAGIRFEPSVTVADLVAAVERLALSGELDVCRELRAGAASGVGLLPVSAHEPGLIDTFPGDSADRAAIGSDLRSVYVAKLLLEQVGDAGLANPRLAKSIVREIADAVLGDRELIALLAELESSELQLVRHGATVAVHAILLGRAIGLPIGVLVELGVAALFHDLGRTTGGDRDHAEIGFERLLRTGVSRLALQAMIVALEHHEPVDDERLRSPIDGIGLFSAIVHCADVYARGAADGRTAGKAALRTAVETGEIPAQLASRLEHAIDRAC